MPAKGRSDPAMATAKTLIIQIPCFNEAATLGLTLGALPRRVPGFAQVEWMVIDDGSTDRTIEVAKAAGADHVVRLGRNQGLARAFAAGIEAALRAGADVIVNTDADNQYCADDIPKLTAPILAGDADLVIGARPIADTPHFSRTKKALQLLGSMVVRMASRTTVVDAPSGFRALSREAALRLHVHGEYTYTLETIIAAGRKNMAVASVPIRTNPDLRPSRLVRSLPDYVFRSAVTIVRSFATYKPLRFFVGVGLAVFGAGLLLSLRYLYLAALGEGAGHLQSVIMSALLMSMGVFTGLIGILADLISVNRRLLEKLLVEQQSGPVTSAGPDADASTRRRKPSAA
jgi:glycosyltransferase involved in cell wall biosynthesis